eukprot:1232792-Amphidinium_carterae.1
MNHTTGERPDNLRRPETVQKLGMCPAFTNSRFGLSRKDVQQASEQTNIERVSIKSQHKGTTLS